MFIVCKSDHTYLKSMDSYGYTFTEDFRGAYPFKVERAAEKLASKLNEIYYSQELYKDFNTVYYSVKQSEILPFQPGNCGDDMYVITTECEKYLRVGHSGSIGFTNDIDFADRFEEAEARYEFERVSMLLNQRGDNSTMVLNEILKVD